MSANCVMHVKTHPCEVSLFGPTIPTENFAKLCENVAPSLAVYEMDGAASTSWRLLTFFHSNRQASNVSRSDFKGKQQVDCCVKACKASQFFPLLFSNSFFPPYIFSQCKTTANNISEWRGASHTNGAREREFMTFTERITEHHRTREMKTLMEFIAFCSWSGKWCLWCCKKNAQLFNHPNSIMSRVNSPFFFLILHIFLTLTSSSRSRFFRSVQESSIYTTSTADDDESQAKDTASNSQLSRGLREMVLSQQRDMLWSADRQWSDL